MYEITLGENNIYQIPSLDFRGTPTGIDIIKVVKKNLPPFIDTGVAHKDPGIGQGRSGTLRRADAGLQRRCRGIRQEVF